MIDKLSTEEAVLTLFGKRLEQRRLEVDLTQARLAREAGVSKSTIERLEAGQAIRTNALARVLRALDLLNSIDALIPPAAPSPMEQLRLQGRQRKRATSRRFATDEKARKQGDWKWGDER